MSNNSRSNLITIAIAAIIALLGFSGYLLYQNNNLQKLSETQSFEIDETEKLKAELEKQYYESLSELEEMRGSNDELNALIEKQKEELKDKKRQISGLLGTKNALSQARTEMEAMRVQLSGYIGEINTLKQQNAELTEKTVQLQANNENLKSNLDSKINENQQLEEVRATLVNEKEALTSKSAALGKKVAIGSVVKVSDVRVTGWKIKDSGKAVKKKYAKNIERLELCFDLLDNAVVEPGQEDFKIRIITPQGETLAIEELGSGILKEKISQQEVRYTTSATVDYQNAAGNFCTKWEPNTRFNKGLHGVEIYNKGYLAGRGSFTLK